MFFKTDINVHNHPSISLFIIEQNTIGETKENNKWHSTQEPRTPKNISRDCDGEQLHKYWYWTTIPVYVYVRPITWTCLYKEYIVILEYILTKFLDGNKGHKEETHRPTHSSHLQMRFWFQ